MLHFMFLILNICTYETFYDHGYFKNTDELKLSLDNNEKLIKVWLIEKEIKVS